MLDKISTSVQNCEIFLCCLAYVFHSVMKDEESKCYRKYFCTNGGKQHSCPSYKPKEICFGS